VAWSHIHPNFFMDNLLTSVPVVNGRFYWFIDLEGCAPSQPLAFV